MQLIIDTANTTITVRNKCFYIQNDTVKRKISPKRLTSIAVHCNCLMDTACIKLAANNQIPVLFFNHFGTIQARTWSPYFVNLAALRKKQLYFSDSVYAVEWVTDLFHRKTDEQVLNLKRLVSKDSRFGQETLHKVNQIAAIKQQINFKNASTVKEIRNTLMGYEGNISKQYFAALSFFMPPDFEFQGRSRRPAMDYFNATLNYFYGMTYSVVESGILAKGLDPQTSMLHVDAYGKPTLAYDLIEPFRPVIDRLVLDLIMEGVLTPTYYRKKGEGYWISKEGKRTVIQSFNDYINTYLEFGGVRKRLKDHIYAESNALGNFIESSITRL